MATQHETPNYDAYTRNAPPSSISLLAKAGS
jgi:hypothetical protein